MQENNETSFEKATGSGVGILATLQRAVFVQNAERILCKLLIPSDEMPSVGCIQISENKKGLRSDYHQFTVLCLSPLRVL